VFPLRYADAKDLVTSLKELFQPPTTQQNNTDRRQQFINRFLGGGAGGFGGGRGRGGGGAGGGGAGSEGGGANARVVAVADERTNSLVVSANEDTMPLIEKIIKEIDVSSTDVTELRVFHLSNADPMEMADIFSQLFPDETKTSSDQQNQQGFRFRGGFGGRGGIAAAQTQESDRMKKKGRVSAVADQRTSSIIVSAASELMPQIAEMVAQLDSSPARKQKVFVYSLENADPVQVESVLREMFERNTSMGNRNNQNQNSPLSTRSQQGATGPTGFGSSTGTGGGGNFGGGGIR
jgi:type II secretory pathway component GspD/PulD (secretin)